MAVPKKKFSVSLWIKIFLGLLIIFALWGYFSHDKTPETTQTVSAAVIGTQVAQAPAAPTCSDTRVSRDFVGKTLVLDAPAGCKINLEPQPAANRYKIVSCVDTQYVTHEPYDVQECDKYTSLTIVTVEAGDSTLTSVTEWFTPAG